MRAILGLDLSGPQNQRKKAYSFFKEPAINLGPPAGTGVKVNYIGKKKVDREANWFGAKLRLIKSPGD